MTVLFTAEDRNVVSLQAEVARLRMELVAAEDTVAALRTETHELHTRVHRMLADCRALRDENLKLRRTLEGGKRGIAVD